MIIEYIINRIKKRLGIKPAIITQYEFDSFLKTMIEEKALWSVYKDVFDYEDTIYGATVAKYQLKYNRVDFLNAL